MGIPDTRLATISGNSNKSLQDLSLTPRPTPRERDLREQVSALLKRKWLVLTIVVISTSLAGLYALSLPSIYESTATLRLDPQDVVMTDSGGRIVDKYHDYDYANTQTRLLSNPQLIRKVVLRLDLPHNPAFSRPQKQGVLNSLRSLLARRSEPPVDSVQPPAFSSADEKDLTPERITELEPYVGAVEAGLKVEPVAQTSLVSVTMTHTDPQLAMQIVDALTKTFVTDTGDYETRGSQLAAETLARQIAELQMKVKQEEDDRLTYLKGHNLPLEKGEGRNLTTDRLSKLSTNYSKLKTIVRILK